MDGNGWLGNRWKKVGNGWSEGVWGLGVWLPWKEGMGSHPIRLQQRYWSQNWAQLFFWISFHSNNIHTFAHYYYRWADLPHSIYILCHGMIYSTSQPIYLPVAWRISKTERVHAVFILCHFWYSFASNRWWASWPENVATQMPRKQQGQENLPHVKSSAGNKTMLVLLHLVPPDMCACHEVCPLAACSLDEVVGHAKSQRTCIRADLSWKLAAYKISPDKPRRLKGWLDISGACILNGFTAPQLWEGRNLCFVLFYLPLTSWICVPVPETLSQTGFVWYLQEFSFCVV